MVWVDGDEWFNALTSGAGTFSSAAISRMDAEFAVTGQVMPADSRNALAAAPPTLTIRGTIKTEKGKGTYRKAHPKTEASVRTTALPAFTAAALQRRLDDATSSEIDGVFPTRNDTWLQVSNVQRRWRR